MSAGRVSMTAQYYEQLILEGLKGLPTEALAEITDFIYFVRKRVFQPQDYENELHSLLLSAELKQLSRNQEAHMEKEFEDYEQRYPRE
jgi:hypothetical protein